MKHHLTALFALAAVMATPAIATAAPLIYPDIPAKVSMDDHMAVVVPLETTAPESHKTAAVVPSNNDPSQALFAADHTYLTSLCPNVLSHPGNFTSMYKNFCQVKAG